MISEYNIRVYVLSKSEYTITYLFTDTTRLRHLHTVLRNYNTIYLWCIFEHFIHKGNCKDECVFNDNEWKRCVLMYNIKQKIKTNNVGCILCAIVIGLCSCNIVVNDFCWCLYVFCTVWCLYDFLSLDLQQPSPWKLLY